jgi:hypothetical protein
VQLAWVTECSFSVAEEDGQKAYYLMATSVGRGAGDALKAREEQARRDAASRQQAIQDKLSELQDALQLPRDEVIARYQGKDDRMLLDLLDAARRGAALIAVHRVLPWLDTIRFAPEDDHYGYGYTLGLLDEDERAAYIAAFGANEIELQDPWVSAGAHITPSAGTLRLVSPRKLNEAGEVVPAAKHTADEYTVLDLRPGATLQPEEQIALRRALGEQISPAQEKAYVERRSAEIAVVKQAEEIKASGAALSPHAAELLAQTALALGKGRDYPSWRIEEEVARATGMHVISDGLLCASASVGSGESGRVAALDALKAFCAQKTSGLMRSPEWEWGDAGSFLRFRTANRDVWRAAMLPQPTVDWLGQQIGPFLPEPEDRPKAASFTLPIDPQQWTWQFGRCSDLQIQYGAQVLQGDPRDLEEITRRATWGAASDLATQAGFALLRFLGGMESDQWQLMRAGNLRWPDDVTPDQGRLLEQVLAEKTMQAIAPQGYARIRIALGEAVPDERGSVSLNTTETPGAKSGSMMETVGSGDVDSRSAKAWHQVTLTAVTDDANGKETLVFKKQSVFLPTTLSVHADLPE